MTASPAPEPAAGRRVLVVGSYPPVHTPGMAVTLAVVRRLIAAGDDPVVASPRTSAAAYDVAVTGVLAARRLRQLRAHSGATRLVLCAEPDLPVPVRFPMAGLLRLVQARTIAELARAAGEFESVTLVIADDLRLPADLVARLRAVAVEVTEPPAAAPDSPDGPWPGVTVLGPDERTPSEKAEDLARKVARRVLGPAAPRVRQALVRAAGTARSR